MVRIIISIEHNFFALARTGHRTAGEWGASFSVSAALGNSIEQSVCAFHRRLNIVLLR